MGAAKRTYFYLYVILDIYSRRVVGWCVVDAENASLFQELFEDTILKNEVPPGQLTLHADRGAPTAIAYGLVMNQAYIASGCDLRMAFGGMG